MADPRKTGLTPEPGAVVAGAIAIRQAVALLEYVFDPRLGYTGRYVSKTTGRMVSADTVNIALEAQITKARNNITALTEQLATDQISLAEWQIGMRQQIKIIHTHAGALARGGWANMSQSDWGAVGQMTKRQYQYLQGFANDIASGKAPLTNLAGEVSGQTLRRADLYGQAGITTHNEMRQREAARGGATHVSRELDPRAKHCGCCIDQAELGWVPIGDPRILPIGSCTCVTNCRCTKQFGREQPDGTITPE